MNKSACKVTRFTRSTGRGAYDDTHLYSIRSKGELNPHKTNFSRTGNHGEKIWFLLPGRYYEATCSISNSGKGGWSLNTLTITAELEEEITPLRVVPEWLRELLPAGCLDEVEPEPYR